jgi:catalase
MPTSSAKESFYSVSVYKFTNNEGVSKFDRYRIVPQDGNEYLEPSAAVKKNPSFLFDEIKDRIAHGTLRMRVLVQVVSDGDVVDDSTFQWPPHRPLEEFGTIELNGMVPDGDASQR